MYILYVDRAVECWLETALEKGEEGKGEERRGEERRGEGGDSVLQTIYLYIHIQVCNTCPTLGSGTNAVGTRITGRPERAVM